MEKITQEKLNEILALHKAWMYREENGRYADLNNMNLSGLDFSHAILHRADLRYANLAGAKLDRADLSKAILHHANLTNANLAGANLDRADLSNAILHHANLTNANLTYADLQNADLHCAVLFDAILRCAFLKKSNLRNAYLNGANLQGAYLGDSDLIDIEIDSFTNCGLLGAAIYAVCGQFGEYSRPLVINAISPNENEWQFIAGCFKGNEKKFREAVIKKHGNSHVSKEYLKAATYLLKLAREKKKNEVSKA